VKNKIIGAIPNKAH